MFAKVLRYLIFISIFGFTLQAQKITYDEHIRPIFKADCSECHNANKAKGDEVGVLLSEAKEYIDEAFNSESTSNDPKMWNYRAPIYLQIALKKPELDKLAIIWSSGYEEYPIYEIDLLQRQLECIKKAKE